jgi:hypothetical protein
MLIRPFFTATILWFLPGLLHAQQNQLSIDWNKTIAISRTTPTLQVVENPMLRKNSPIHDGSFNALRNLGADYVRYVPWFPYTKMAVAELKAPTTSETFWDFSYLDSTMKYFMEATKGHSVVINFSTTPVWMWKTTAEVKYPDNPYEVYWDYNQGTDLKDTSCKQIAGYYARVMRWYTQGGFTDELGKYHRSDLHYNIPYWEVLNEPDFEHSFTPQRYTKIYDAIVSELKKISPNTKFIGVSLAFESNPEWFEYFLNPKNHRPGIPLDGISYHHYSTPSYSKQPLEEYQYTFFDKANAFLDKVRYIENIRQRLSPGTITTINEIGTIINSNDGEDIPKDYWNLSGAMYAYLYIEMTKIGIDVAGESQLVGYPTQFPDVSMIDWKSGNPNGRYWVLKLVLDNFGKGDKLVSTTYTGDDLIAQAFITTKGKRLLLINPRNKELKANLPGEVVNSMVHWADVTTGEAEAAPVKLTDSSITLKPFAVVVLQLNK